MAATLQSFFISLLCLLFLYHCTTATVVGVDPQLRESIEEFLKTVNKSSDDKPELSTTNSNFPIYQKTKSRSIELIEEALGLVYNELYNANFTRSSRALSLNARQSFFSNGLAGLSEYLMSLVENSLEDLPSLPRLEAQECMKRSVCEAHNQPKKYGLMGLILQLLFPPYTKAESLDNVASKYQLAARYGRQSNANCGIQYDGCMLNLLDIVQAMVNAFIR